MKSINNDKLKWMMLPDEYSDFEKSKFIVLPVAYEKDLTYGVGAANGACEIVNASSHLEYFDEEFNVEYFEEGVFVHPLLELNDESPESMLAKVQETVSTFGSGKFVIGLGGDHAITIGFVKGLEKFQGDFAVLQIDAHSDFRESWNGNQLNHACVIRRIVDEHEIIAVGIRAQDKDERLAIDANTKIQTIYGFEYSLEKVKSALLNLKSEKLYVTIDVDGFDPSVISCTGTPEPNGLLWQQVIDILKLCFSMKKVIGADVVEFAPTYLENDGGKEVTNWCRVEAYTLARLVSKIMSLVVKK